VEIAQHHIMPIFLEIVYIVAVEEVFQIAQDVSVSIYQKYAEHATNIVFVAMGLLYVVCVQSQHVQKHFVLE
jgi:hypothetical protein